MRYGEKPLDVIAAEQEELEADAVFEAKQGDLTDDLERWHYADGGRQLKQLEEIR